MKKYVCTMCGYVYDPEKGDPVMNRKPAGSPLATPAVMPISPPPSATP